MGIRELRQEASRLGIKYSGLKKSQLEPLVSAAVANERQSESHVVRGSDIVARLIAGSVEETGCHLGSLTKSESREVRRALRTAGHSAHSAAIRIVQRDEQAAVLTAG